MRRLPPRPRPQRAPRQQPPPAERPQRRPRAPRGAAPARWRAPRHRLRRRGHGRGPAPVRASPVRLRRRRRPPGPARAAPSSGSEAAHPRRPAATRRPLWRRAGPRRTCCRTKRCAPACAMRLPVAARPPPVSPISWPTLQFAMQPQTPAADALTRQSPRQQQAAREARVWPGLTATSCELCRDLCSPDAFSPATRPSSPL
mmetsp:Transcript_95251/g.308500  ORF Transcript_95251/g.308500 Transcript_95251/m.308500 type:complete len:201 (+) Transcript_95251:386-988(+)